MLSRRNLYCIVIFIVAIILFNTPGFLALSLCRPNGATACKLLSNLAFIIVIKLLFPFVLVLFVHKMSHWQIYLQRHKNAQVPWWHVIDSIGDVRFILFLFWFTELNRLQLFWFAKAVWVHQVHCLKNIKYTSVYSSYLKETNRA